MDQTAEDGKRPLFMAAQNGHHAAVRALLDAGASVNEAAAHSGATPLLMAAMRGHLQVSCHA